MAKPETQIEGLVPSREQSLVSQEVMPRRFKHWIVADRELNTLGFMSALGTAAAVFLGIFVGAAISVGLTLKTVDIPVGKTYLFFAAGFLVSLVGSAMLLVLLVVSLVRTARDVETIKKESEQEQRRLELLKESA
jgi:hypothetical protein